MNIAAFVNSSILELKDIDEDKLVPGLTFEQLALDSLDYVEIQLLIQKEYGVNLEPELFETGKLSSLGELYAYIESHATQKLQEVAA